MEKKNRLKLAELEVKTFATNLSEKQGALEGGNQFGTSITDNAGACTEGC